MSKKLFTRIFKISERNKTITYFSGLFLFLVIVMHKAFAIDFFLDDFFFLKVGRAENINDFLNFFSPFKDYFYRPIPTEVFYMIINFFNRNLFVAHSIVFFFYFLGIVFLFKSSKKITKNLTFSFIFTFIYSISHIHVFQLYQLATFIEIALFTFLVMSFYFYVSKRFILSVLFFIFALMSKETAVLFPVLLLSYEIIFVRKINKETVVRILAFFALSLTFILIFKQATSEVLAIDTYKIILSPKLILHNLMWYFLWSLGLPNFVPNYLQSILFKPTPDFWNLFSDLNIKIYFYILILFYSLFIPTVLIVLINKRKKLKSFFILFGTLSFFFVIFISPTLPIIHKWMVRLTLPLIFLSIFYATIIYFAYKTKGYIRIVSVFLLILYLIISVFGIRIHESSGLFLMNSQTIKNLRAFIKDNEGEIKKFNTVYFVSSSEKDFGGSIELKNMLGTTYFTDTFFPNENKKIIYGHEQNLIPKNSFVIESLDIAEW